MRMLGERAVVLGASMGGLLAARVLSEAYERVTVVERDRLPALSANRRGVPQGRHVHTLLAGGARVLEEFFPGVLDDVVATGAPLLRNLSDFWLSLGGHVLCRDDYPLAGVACYQPSRPHLERHVRDRLRALGNVEIIEQTDVVGLEHCADRTRVIGARIARRVHGHAEETLAGDLIVDTSGRAGRATTWLTAMGYEPPAEEQLPIQLSYVTQHLRLAPGAAGCEKLVIVAPEPARPVGLLLFGYEDGVWMLTLTGYGAQEPPGDPAARLDVVRELAPPHVYAAVRAAEPLSEVFVHRTPANLRRRYERLRRFPDGLLVLGDAICSFNPAYGQGMSVAALQAWALRDTLATGDGQLFRRYFQAAAKPIDVAWQLAIGGDLALPVVEGHRPLSVRLVNAYIDRLLTAAGGDPVLAERFLRVNHFLDTPNALLSPAVVRRVVAGNRRRHRPKVPVVPELYPPATEEAPP